MLCPKTLRYDPRCIFVRLVLSPLPANHMRSLSLSSRNRNLLPRRNYQNYFIFHNAIRLWISTALETSHLPSPSFMSCLKGFLAAGRAAQRPPLTPVTFTPTQFCQSELPVTPSEEPDDEGATFPCVILIIGLLADSFRKIPSDISSVQ